MASARRSESLAVDRGINKYLVGQTAANIRRLQPPEPYKGKGMRHEDELIRRKAASGRLEERREGFEHDIGCEQEIDGAPEASPSDPQEVAGHGSGGSQALRFPQLDPHLRAARRRRPGRVAPAAPRLWSPAIREDVKGLKKIERSKRVGLLIAKLAREKGRIEKVAFDRGGYWYHGRVRGPWPMAPVRAG